MVGTLYFACFYLVGALLALASGKAERRQVHPLKIAKTKNGDSKEPPFKLS